MEDITIDDFLFGFGQTKHIPLPGGSVQSGGHIESMCRGWFGSRDRSIKAHGLGYVMSALDTLPVCKRCQRQAKKLDERATCPHPGVALLRPTWDRTVPQVRAMAADPAIVRVECVDCGQAVTLDVTTMLADAWAATRDVEAAVEVAFAEAVVDDVTAHGDLVSALSRYLDIPGRDAVALIVRLDTLREAL